VNARVGHKVGLELRDINIEGTIESERGGQGGYDLSDESVQVGVGRSLDVQVSAAYIVQGLVIQAESTVSVLKEGMSGEDVVVWLDNCSRHLRSRGHGE
jgi:hypothetical protein